MKPTLSRSVHFVTIDNRHHAAMIVYVSDDSRCNLTIWDEFGQQYFREEVPFDAQATILHSWHWPEKAEEAAVVSSGTEGSSGSGGGVPVADQAKSN